jgi:hypothetical protein
MIRQFLVDLPNKWQNYSSTVRNRLLKLLIEKVELQHDVKTIEATVYWKTGFREQVNIQRVKAAFNQDSIWSDQEDRLLETLWPNASIDTVLKALPGRTLSALRNHAQYLGLKRMKKSGSSTMQHRWTKHEETQAHELYEGGTPVPEIALKLNLNQAAIEQHAKAGKWNRPSWFKQRKKPVIWKVVDQNFKGFQEESSRWNYSPINE